MATDVETGLVVRMEATLAKFERQLDRGRAKARTVSTGIERDFDRMGARMGRASTRAAGGLTGLVNVSGAGRFVLQNTAAQIGDMAVQLESGTNASRVMAQQLPQLFGGFGALGGALGVVAPLLGLVAAVGIPLGAMFLNMGRDADEGAEKVKSFADKLKAAESAIESATQAAANAGAEGLDQLVKKYGLVTKAVTDLADALAELERGNAVREVQSALSGLFEGPVQGELDAVFGPIGSAVVDVTNEAIEASRSALREAETDIANMIANGLQPMPEQIALVATLREELALLSGEFDAAPGLTEQLKLDPAALQGLQDARRLVQEALAAENFSGAATALAEMRQALLAAGLTIESELVQRIIRGEDLVRQMAARFGEAEANAAGVAGAAGGIAGPVGAAADEAARLSGNLATALSQLRSVVSGIQTAQRRALNQLRIRESTIGDPAGRAAGLERERFNEASGSAAFEAIRSGNTSVLREMSETADRLAGGAADIAAAEERLSAAEKEFAKSLSGSSSRGGSSGGSRGGAAQADPVAQFMARREAEAEALERQLELLGKTQAEVTELEIRWRLLDEAKRAGIDIDAALTASGETLRQSIERQSAALAEMTERVRQGQASQQALTQLAQDVASSLATAFREAVTGARSFKDAMLNALSNVLAKIGEAIIQMTIFNALARIFGLPGQSSGLLSALGLGLGGRARGGGVDAGEPVLVNEDTARSEIFVPSQSGGILNVQQAQSALSRAALARMGGARDISVAPRSATPAPAAPMVNVNPEIDVISIVSDEAAASIVARPGAKTVILTMLEREGFQRG